MKTKTLFLALMLSSFSLFTIHAFSCSTFKLQKGKGLVYGHNLNQGDIGVPGMIFINKRGVFKIGRTWSELTTKERNDPSGFSWISRYGSVTFNCFGKDLPDGGMNEAGLFIWEMSEDPEYPTGTGLPKLDQMSWMQYILDNYSTTDEALQATAGIEICGWGWHYFIGDAQGNVAALTWVDGEMLVYKNEDMPVAGLFNEPYAREMEVLKYFKGYGGDYEIDISDEKVPRIAKAAKLIDEYCPEEDIVEYGLQMLDKLQVSDEPEWSVLFDEKEMKVYFKTRLNPEIKSLSMNDIDFSNDGPSLILDIDEAKSGEEISQLHPYTNYEFSEFTKSKVFPIFPEQMLTAGGLTLDEYLIRMSSHSDEAEEVEKQFFAGSWKNEADTAKDETSILIFIKTNASTVHASLSFSGSLDNAYNVDHLQMIGENIRFTLKTKKGTLLEVKAVIKEDEMVLDLAGIEDFYGSYSLKRIKD
ncbi:hypothetical protein ACFLRY_02615 [Bacteroidota bacterium]